MFGAYLLRLRSAIALLCNGLRGGRGAIVGGAAAVVVVGDGEDKPAGVYDNLIASRCMTA